MPSNITVTKWAAAEMLLALLSEMAPDEIPNEKADLRASLKALDMALQFDDPPMSGSSRHSTDATDDASVAESAISLASRYTSYSKSGKSMSFRSNFFPQQPAAALSLLTVAQAKWAEDDPISQVDLPLVDANQKGGVLSLNCVIPKISPQSCASAQRGCISLISDLRRDLPIISSSTSESQDPHYAFSLAGSPDKGDPVVPPPLGIVSVAVVPSESHLLLQRFKAGGKSTKGGSMATFYNPYDKKKEADKKIQITLVAEGEERELTIEFSNRLAVPLDVPSCQIEFGNGNSDRIKAPALSFVVPPKAKKFAVQFPFIVMNTDHTNDSEDGSANVDESPQPDMFDIKGLRVTCLSRSYFIPLTKYKESAARQVPDPASVYERRAQYDRARHEEMVKPRLEVVPAQPKLHMEFAASGTDIADGMTVPIHLSDGEVFTLPSFRIYNDFGPTGLGTIKRLQIIGAGLPGTPDEILFDTDMLTNDDREKDVFFESYDEDSEKDMDSESMPPLKMKVLSDGLSLVSINDRGQSRGKESIVKFQMVASHDFGNHIGKCGNVRLRVRYRGASADPAAEIWRKTEVHLHVVRLKGPRISSLAFRPDLSWGSAYSELSKALAEQKAEYDANKKAWKMTSDDDASSDGGAKVNVETSIVARVGLDSGVHVSSRDVALVMSVANETDSTIVLSNRKGMVGGFDVSPMPTVKIPSGVSAKIPLVIPRVRRVNDDDGCATDIVADLVSQLGLQWETLRDEQIGSSDVKGVSRKIRQGQIRIPSSCLREIIKDNQSFASRICEPPVSIQVNVGRKDFEQHLLVSAGSSVDTFVDVKTAGKSWAAQSTVQMLMMLHADVLFHVLLQWPDWVPADVAAKCRITLEFCAARKEKPTERGSFVWCGLVRRTMRLNDAEKSHRARVVFLKDGEYVISACARLTNDEGNGAEETWWAPIAENVVVEMNDNAAQ